MTPSEIKQYITKQSQYSGIDPSLSLGLAELSGFSPNWTDGKRAGIMSLNKEYIADMDGYKKDPQAQIDAGVLLLSKNLKDNNNEFAALNSYTQSNKNSLKAFLRTARNRGQNVTEDDVNNSINALGLDLNAIEEAQKAGLILSKKTDPIIEAPTEEVINSPVADTPVINQGQQQAILPQQQPELEQPIQQQLQPQKMQYTEEETPIIKSTKEQKNKRINAVFGKKENTGDVPDDLLLYIKGII